MISDRDTTPFNNGNSDIFNDAKINESVDAGHGDVKICGEFRSAKSGTVIRYKKAGNLRTYVGKILSFNMGSAFPLKVETFMEFGKTITNHRLEDFTQYITGEGLHEARFAARRLNEQYVN